MNEIGNINWLSQEDYDKSIGQLRIQMLGIFEPFKQYGQDVYIPQMIVVYKHPSKEAVKL